MKKPFRLDKKNAMFLGVCSGLADYLGVDATWVRVAAVAVTVLHGFPWTFIAYGVVAWLAQPKGERWGSAVETFKSPPTERPVNDRISEVDTFVAGTDSSLAREIDALR